MDGRKFFVLALAASLGCLGCAGQQKEHRPESPLSALTALTTGKPSEASSRELRIGFEFARLRETQADDPKFTAPQREAILDESRKAYQEVLKRSPNHIEATAGLARVYVGLNDYERAMATYNEALKKHPKQASLWFDLSRAHAKKKDFARAAESCKKAHELDPENRTYTKTLSIYLAASGQHEAGFSLLKRLDGEARAHVKMAQILARLEQPELTRQHLQLALQKEPNLDSAREMLARLEAGQRSPIATVSFETPAQGPSTPNEGQ